jgi:hypothetical protein
MIVAGKFGFIFSNTNPRLSLDSKNSRLKKRNKVEDLSKF